MRSPTMKPVTPEPIASTTPALSMPSPDGSDFTVCWPRLTNMSRKLSATAVWPHPEFAGAGRREVHVLVAHHLGAAGLVEAERFHDEFSAPVMARFRTAKKPRRTACRAKAGGAA